LLEVKVPVAVEDSASPTPPQAFNRWRPELILRNDPKKRAAVRGVIAEGRRWVFEIGIRCDRADEATDAAAVFELLAKPSVNNDGTADHGGREWWVNWSTKDDSLRGNVGQTLHLRSLVDSAVNVAIRAARPQQPLALSIHR
jgi:hypothetical protein